MMKKIKVIESFGRYFMGKVVDSYEPITEIYAK